MSHEPNAPTIDLIRLTFIIDPARRTEVETYLADLGLDVQVRGEDLVVATWEEPQGDVDQMIDGLWAAHGEPFEVTHEEFQRLDLVLYHHEEEIEEAGREVA